VAISRRAVSRTVAVAHPDRRVRDVGLTAGIAAFLGAGFYGSASSGDAQGYELYVIASAVVGGASLLGGKGSALGGMLGALLIVLIRQSIRTLHFDQNYEWIVVGCAIVLAVVVTSGVGARPRGD
jgi:ribose transport system permease protein